jgi:tripartite-type tricarboxylate transporter receptor subunit TctC
LGAGGGTDGVSRIIATLLKTDLGVPVNKVNRTGGSGAVGHTAMATAKPDGYTIGMPTVEITMMQWMGLTKITYKDMPPVAMVNFDPAGINVRTDSPWRVYYDLETYVRNNPGKLKDSGVSSQKVPVVSKKCGTNRFQCAMSTMYGIQTTGNCRK